jgi:hypothetical protein
VQGPAAGSCLGLTLRSTAGDVLLDDSVECSGRHDQGPLIVEASGVFAAGSNDCIGLSAGGTLDTSSGSFDRPISASCP